MTTKTFVDGKVWVRRRQCKTCIFRPEGKGRLLGITDERVAEMVAGATANETCIPCHHHLHQGADVEPVCAGFARQHPTLPIRLAEAMDVIGWVE
jgi:hypothetical protein